MSRQAYASRAVGYRPPSAAPVTPWARHLDKAMRDRGWSRVRLFEEIGAELGYGPKSRSGFLPLLVDREPTPQQAAILAKHFGEPEAQPDPVVGPGSDTLPGLADLAAAIAALVDELRAAREEREGYEVRLRAVEAELESLRDPPAGEGSPGRSVPLATTGLGR